MMIFGRTFTNGHAVLLVRWFLGVVFLISALGKIADPAAFADSVVAYRLLPNSLVNLFAIVLPWIEFLVGLSLLNGLLSRSAALLAVAMNAMFVIAAVSAIVRGLDIGCGCFTAAESTVGWGLIGRDLVFLAVALVCYRNSGTGSLSPVPFRRSTAEMEP